MSLSNILNVANSSNNSASSNGVPPKSYFADNLHNCPAAPSGQNPMTHSDSSFSQPAPSSPLGSSTGSPHASPPGHLMSQSPSTKPNYFKTNSSGSPAAPKANERSYSFSSFIFAPPGSAQLPRSGSLSIGSHGTMPGGPIPNQTPVPNVSGSGTPSTSLQNPNPSQLSSLNNPAVFGVSPSANPLTFSPPPGGAGPDFLFSSGNSANSSKFRSVLSASFSGPSPARDRDLNLVGSNALPDDNTLFMKHFSISSPRDSTSRSDLPLSSFTSTSSPKDDEKCVKSEGEAVFVDDDEDFINNPGVISASQLLFDDDLPTESDTSIGYRNSVSNILTSSSPSLTNIGDSMFRSASITLLNNLQHQNQSPQQLQQLQSHQPRQNRSVSAAVLQAETTNNKFPILVRRQSSVSYANTPAVGFPSRSRNNSAIFNLDSTDGACPLQMNTNHRVSSNAATTRCAGSNGFTGSDSSPDARTSDFFKISGMSSYDMNGNNNRDDSPNEHDKNNININASNNASDNAGTTTTNVHLIMPNNNHDQDNDRRQENRANSVQYNQSFTELPRVGSQNTMLQPHPSMVMQSNNYMSYQPQSQQGSQPMTMNGDFNSLNTSMSPMNMAINPMNMNPNMNPMNINPNVNPMNMSPMNHLNPMNPMNINPMNVNPMNMNPMNAHMSHAYGNNTGPMNPYMMNGMPIYNPNMNPSLMHPSYGNMYNMPPTGPMGTNSNSQEPGSRGNGGNKGSNNQNFATGVNNSNNNTNNNISSNNSSNNSRNNSNHNNSNHNNNSNKNNNTSNDSSFRNNLSKNHKNDRTNHNDHRTNEDTNSGTEANTKHKKSQSNENNSSTSNETRRQNEQDIAQRFANMELESMTKEIYTLCKDQHGCRFLQKKLEDKDPKYLDIIFEQTYPHVVELMTDPFGNYLCQKLLEHVRVDQRTILVKTAAPELMKIALNQHGTRALQKMIEFVSTPEQISIIVKALNTNVVKLIEDLNGNHVIQKCLNRLSNDDSQFIFDAVSENCVAVGTHRHGCCVLQRCIDHASDKQKSQLINEITKNSFDLVQDPFGNYVIQYVLDLNDNKTFSEPLIQRFLDHICTLSMQKFSSNVIEKCLRIAETSTRKKMIEELVNTTYLDKLLKDSYANYVIQTALDFADPETRLRLIHNIEPIMPVIRGTPYGRRIQSKIANVTNNNQGGASSIPHSGHTGNNGPSSHYTGPRNGNNSGPSEGNSNGGGQYLMPSHPTSDTGSDFLYQNLHQQHHQQPSQMQHRNNSYHSQHQHPQRQHPQQNPHQHQMRQFPYNY